LYKMQSFVLILLMVAIVFMIIGYINQLKTCPPPIIEYRYIPRTFKEEQESPVPIDDVYGSMFEQASPWVGSFTKNNIRTLRDQNYVSQ